MIQRIPRYRAYHTKLKKMMPVLNIELHPEIGGVEVAAPGPPLYDTLEDQDYRDSWSWDDCVLMQFTGVKDKHGREIYEGDIITCNHSDIVDGYTWLVTWHGAGFYPFNDVDERSHGELHWYGLREQLETFEVIGNIYEHPELASKAATP